MKRFAICVVLTILHFFNCSAQQTKKIEAKIQLKADSTLIMKEIEVRTIFLFPKLIDPRSIQGRDRIWLNRRKKDYILTADIEYLTLKDLKNRKRSFSSTERIKRLHHIQNLDKLEKLSLVEEIICDSLAWYKSYETNSYDNSVITLNYYILEGEIKFINDLINRKKNFLELVMRFPEVVAMVDQQASTENIIRRYNELTREPENR